MQIQILSYRVKGGIDIAPGDDEWFQNPRGGSTTSKNLVEVLAIKMPEMGGVVRVSFTFSPGTAGGPSMGSYFASAQIYVNDIPRGILRTVDRTTDYHAPALTAVEDISFSAGDKIQVYLAHSGQFNSSGASQFKMTIKALLPFPEVIK